MNVIIRREEQTAGLRNEGFQPAAYLSLDVD